MSRVVLGNRHAIDSTDDGVTFAAMKKGKRATIIDTQDTDTLVEQFLTITSPGGVWTHHAVGPSGEVQDANGDTVQREVIHADAKPAWVASDNPALAQLIAAHYGCEVRELEDVKDKDGGTIPGGAIPAMLGLMLALPFLGLLLAMMLPLLKTNAGNDFQYAQMAGSASATAVGKWVALTANTTSPTGSDTTLSGEITTAGGGLIRKAGTPAHTTGASSYTITTTFTANGNDSLPVTIGKRGIFDASTSGNLIFSTLVSPTATLSASGDALTLTDTVSM